MKTQTTVETNDSVRTLIALKLTGELRLASRDEVRAYFERANDLEVNGLQSEIETMATAYGDMPGYQVGIDDE